MPTYSINPYVSSIENRLLPGVVQSAVLHRLTGKIIENGDKRLLIERQFLIPDGFDPLAPLLDHYVTRPIQNPALAGDLDSDAARRNLQLEAAAHIRVQAEVDDMAARQHLPDSASPDFIRWLHREFYRDAPDEM